MKRFSAGFTLIETMVAIGVLAVVGLIIADLLSKGFQGNNKTLIVGNLKQNGQVLLNILDQNIRNADSILCIGKYPDTLTTNNTIVILKNGQYIRYRFIPPIISGTTANGYVTQDSPPTITDQSDPTQYAALCTNAVLTSPITLTDTNKVNGISVKDGNFTRLSTAGSKDAYIVSFTLSAGVGAPAGFQNQVADTIYQTTIQLR